MSRHRIEPAWLTRIVIDAIHTDQVREHGGLPGLRDENGLEAALARPRHKWSYEQSADLASLAAAYGFGLARNHPYCDGNKRVSLVQMLAFLDINGQEIEAADEDVLTTVIGLAAGHVSERELAAWLRARMVPPAPRGKAGALPHTCGPAKAGPPSPRRRRGLAEAHCGEVEALPTPAPRGKAGALPHTCSTLAPHLVVTSARPRRRCHVFLLSQPCRRRIPAARSGR